MFKNLDMGNDKEFKKARNRILKKLKRLQEENKANYQLSARKNGKTIELARNFYNKVKTLEKDKMFGIINFGAGIVITKNEVIEKNAIKEFLVWSKANYIDAIHADNKVEAVQKYIKYLEKELLEGK